MLRINPIILAVSFTILAAAAVTGCGGDAETEGILAAAADQQAAATAALLVEAGTEAAYLVPDRYATIQEALDAAADGAVIVVRPGDYPENIDFGGKAVTLRGIDPFDEAVVRTTVIRGDGAGPVVTFQNGESEQAVLAGFTVTGGGGYGVPGYPGCYGGAVLVAGQSSPVIMNNIIEANQPSRLQPDLPGYGGGIAVLESDPFISGNLIRGNRAFAAGGAIYIVNASPVIQGNTLSGNEAKRGGGIAVDSGSSPVITGNTIRGNSAVDGGGLHLWGSAPLVLDNLISGNEAAVYGGGIAVWKSDPVIRNNGLERNEAGVKGGAISVTRESTLSPVTRLLNTFRRNNPDALYYQPIFDS